MVKEPEEGCCEGVEPKEVLKRLVHDIPAGFVGMYVRIMKEGLLNMKEKELISVAVSLALRCEPCIEAHLKSALRQGVSVGELLEAAGVTVALGGEPVYLYAQKMVEYLDEMGAFAQEDGQM